MCLTDQELLTLPACRLALAEFSFPSLPVSHGHVSSDVILLGRPDQLSDLLSYGVLVTAYLAVQSTVITAYCVHNKAQLWHNYDNIFLLTMRTCARHARVLYNMSCICLKLTCRC